MPSKGPHLEVVLTTLWGSVDNMFVGKAVGGLRVNEYRSRSTVRTAICCLSFDLAVEAEEP